MPDPTDDLFVTRSLTIPSGELRWRFSGSGGPGGQHANTSNTKVMLTWNVEASGATTEPQKARLIEQLGPIVRIFAADERSQTRNRDLALERLRDRVRAALAVRSPRRPTAPTKSSVNRRLDEKRQRSDRKAERHVGRDLED